MTPEQLITQDPGFADRLAPDGYGADYSQLQDMVFSQLDIAGFDVDEKGLIGTTVAFVESKFSGSPKEYRHSGDHVMVHFLSMVNEYLVDGGKRCDLVQAMLLHDTLEDTVDPKDKQAQETFMEQLNDLAGERVAKMVVALTKIRSANFDRGSYVDFGISQDETNLQLLMTLFDESGQITDESLHFARDVWLVKAYDIRHNLRTLGHHHEKKTGKSDVAKQMAKARLALTYQAPVLYGLGLVREARVIEDLALPVVAQTMAGRNKSLRESLYGAEYMNQVSTWWREFSSEQMIDDDLSRVFDLPPLREVLTDLPTIRLYLESDDKASEVWKNLATAYPNDNLDMQANYQNASYPWQKVVVLRNDQKLLVEIHSAKTQTNRDRQIIEFVHKSLDPSDRASYMRLASEFMSQHSRREIVKIYDHQNRERLINKGARWLDYVFSIAGLDGMLKAKNVMVIREGKELVLDLGEHILAADQVLEVEYGEEVHQPLMKLDKLSVRFSSGGWESMRQWLSENMSSLDRSEVITRGHQILGWLYRNITDGQDLDMYATDVFDNPRDYVSFLESLGVVLYRASDAEDYASWLEIDSNYRQSSTIADSDQVVLEALEKAHELVELRRSLPIVTIYLPDQEKVVQALGVEISNLGMNIMPLRGEPYFDPAQPTQRLAKVVVVLSKQDQGKVEKLRKALEQMFPGASVELSQNGG